MKIVSAKQLGPMPVYDLSVCHEHHSFVHSSGVVAHNCAYVIANEPIQNFIPLMTISDVRVTQYTAASVEAVGGLKMDFLVINSLKDIAKCIKLIQDRSNSGVDWSTSRRVIPDDEEVPSMTINGKKTPYIRSVPFKGQFFDIWDLPEDQDVFREICQGKTETVFQFNTPSARQWLREFMGEDGRHALRSIEDLAAFTALDRPGPLDYVVEGRNMLQEYAARARGEAPVQPNPVLLKLLPKTNGIIVYQEQLQKVFQEVGRTTGIQANNFRDDIGKKRMAKVMAWKEVFMKGAVESIGQESASKLWDGMETFGQYGFNKSHSVCYVVIGYACAWLKHHFPLEWWTSVLSHAERKEVEQKFWPYCGDLIDTPDLKMSGHDFEIQGERIRAPLWLLNGIGPGAHEELCAGMPYTDIFDVCNKIEAKKLAGAKTTEDGKVRKGRSSLNRTILMKLIISGAADALFPPSMDVYDKFNLFKEAEEKAAGGKKTKKLDARFTQLGPIERFQMKKSILPSYGANLTEMFTRLEKLPEWLKVRQQDDGTLALYGETDRYFGQNGDDEFKCLPGPDLELVIKEIVPVGVPAKVAAIAYVNATRPFVYQGNKQACEIHLEVDGHRFQFVRWGGKDGVLQLPDDLDGSIVAVTLVKFKEDRPFNIDDIAILQPALGLKAEEST